MSAVNPYLPFSSPTEHSASEILWPSKNSRYLSAVSVHCQCEELTALLPIHKSSLSLLPFIAQ